jgi:hypothetical protein
MGAGSPGLSLFTRNLPINVSKSQDLKLKIRACFAISGVGVPPPFFVERPPPFLKFLDPPLYIYINNAIQQMIDDFSCFFSLSLKFICMYMVNKCKNRLNNQKSYTIKLGILI